MPNPEDVALAVLAVIGLAGAVIVLVSLGLEARRYLQRGGGR